MSLPPQVNTDKSGNHRGAAMKEPVQHSGEVYYGMGPPALEVTHPDPASSSGVYNPEKGPQSLPHYQQAAPVKWMHQEPIQAPGWSQETPQSAWGQNFGPYMSGVNSRGQMAFHKGVHEGGTLSIGGENQLPANVEPYRDASQPQAQGRGLEWEQHAMAAMHQVQLQAYRQAHKGMDLQGQPHVPSHNLQGSMSQPFQTMFRPSKQFSPGYYSLFPGNKGVRNMSYSEQPKSQQQLLQQMQQQQQQIHHQQQQQQQQQQQHQQQQLHQQHQLQLQQQIQQQQIQQQYHQQQLQERQQHFEQMQQLQKQSVPQQDATQLQVQPKLQQSQNYVNYQPPDRVPPVTLPVKADVQSLETRKEADAQMCEASSVSNPCSEKFLAHPTEPSDASLAAPRRSRRLSREGQSPLGPPPTNIWSQESKETSQNGAESQAATGGVIQITSRRRRASKEINLETLAQQASKMEPAKLTKPAMALLAKRKNPVPMQNSSKDLEDAVTGRQAMMLPLIMPVSVPVHRIQPDAHGGWASGRLGPDEQPPGQSERKPSVIVASRRPLQNLITESFGQDEETDPGLDEDGKSKFKRRPRPEPLIIPPHKPSTFIPPSLYSTISSYQSNLRSPVRLPEHPATLPPYTPPPILSPMREGSGLYCSTFLANIASNQSLPPPPLPPPLPTPKSGTRSLLRSTSSEVTPPVLPLITDATPVSLEPRINIGERYQAEIPALRDQHNSQFDQHKANLVWEPVDESHLKPSKQQSVEELMSMACSSVLRGGGTNQELVLHCLHECGGDILETLERLMLRDPLFPRGHRLADYHYSGCDCWTAEEKRYFNKGISAYRKDFFMVQKLVQSKTVAQCVEFYYTYKRQVKIGHNRIFTFGPPNSPGEKRLESVVDVKNSQLSRLTDEDVNKDATYNRVLDSSHQARVAQSLQAHDYAVTIQEPTAVNKETHPPTAAQRPRPPPAAKKNKEPTKPPQDADAVFPCKKCSRVFYKVKSRSAHMKSHAEQEKKAAALRQKEEEEQAAARARKAASAAEFQGENGSGITHQAEVSGQEDSSEVEDDDDEDWH